MKLYFLTRSDVSTFIEEHVTSSSGYLSASYGHQMVVFHQACYCSSSHLNSCRLIYWSTKVNLIGYVDTSTPLKANGLGNLLADDSYFNWVNMRVMVII